jgi:hypothetical protein
MTIDIEASVIQYIYIIEETHKNDSDKNIYNRLMIITLVIFVEFFFSIKQSSTLNLIATSYLKFSSI